MDANGHKYWFLGRLLVFGSLRNVGDFTLGSFGTPNVSSNVYVNGVANLWGGGSNSDLVNEPTQVG